MLYIANMNLQERVEQYVNRRTQQSDAEILVLIEESASALFSAFPDHFVLVGGATLVLLYESPRVSHDLDLQPRREDLPPIGELERVVAASIQPLGDAFGLGELEFERQGADGSFPKIWVHVNQRQLFSIDISRIGGTVIDSEIVQETIAGDKTVFAPTQNNLLLQKCETFFNRRIVKTRDAFDIDFLLSKQAKLDANLIAHLDDFLLGEYDSEFIRSRIDSVDSKRCTAELRSVLPIEIFEALAKEDFKRLRDSLESVFARWL
jgi:hypothetical protein